MTPQTKKQQISILLTEIKDIKLPVTTKYYEETAIRKKMNDFLAQYQSYLGELDKQVESFAEKVANAHSQLENLNRSQESRSQMSEDPTVLDNFPSTVESIQQSGQIDKPLETGNVSDNVPIEIPSSSPDDPVVNVVNEKEAKGKILRHFASFWHPDHNIKKNDFMVILNTAFNESSDSAEFLAAIPWDTAWEERRSDESIGNQWERLTDWYTALEIANERLDQKLASIKNDWRYPLLSDWDKGAAKMDFFTDLANRKRDEIKSLESTLQVLLQEIHNIKPDEAG